MKNKIAKHFYVKEAKKDRKGHAPIYLRITVNGRSASNNGKNLWNTKKPSYSIYGQGILNYL